MTASNEYRARIYRDYGAKFQDAGSTFDRDAAERWARTYRYHLRGLLPDARDASILELACGGGRMLHLLRTLGYTNVTGVDISPDQVAIAAQTGVRVEQANVLDYLEAHVGAYDLVLGFDIIEHFHKPEVMRFLEGCYRAMRPGGRIVLQTPNADSPWGTVHRYNDFTHEVAFNRNALARLLALVGFDLPTARELGPIPYGHSARSSARYILWQSIRMMLKVWNLAETGDQGSGVFTRVFLISAVRPT